MNDTFADFLARNKIGIVGQGFPAFVFTDILACIVKDNLPGDATLNWLEIYRPDIYEYFRIERVDE